MKYDGSHGAYAGRPVCRPPLQAYRHADSSRNGQPKSQGQLQRRRGKGSNKPHQHHPYINQNGLELGCRNANSVFQDLKGGFRAAGGRDGRPRAKGGRGGVRLRDAAAAATFCVEGSRCNSKGAADRRTPAIPEAVVATVQTRR